MEGYVEIEVYGEVNWLYANIQGPVPVGKLNQNVNDDEYSFEFRIKGDGPYSMVVINTTKDESIEYEGYVEW